jgi:hypothetical protein
MSTEEAEQTMQTQPNGSWNSWGNHVLEKLEQNDDDHAKIQICLIEVKCTLERLKIQAGMWGLIGGAIPVFIGLGIVIIKLYVK